MSILRKTFTIESGTPPRFIFDVIACSPKVVYKKRKNLPIEDFLRRDAPSSRIIWKRTKKW